MMKIIAFLLAFSPIIAFAQAKQQPVISTIQHVTVFFNGAQVMRAANAPLSTGKTELIFKGLTPNMDAQSMQVKGEGDFIVMSVVHQMNYFEEPEKKDTVKILEQQRDILADKISVEADKVTVLQQQEAMLQRNQVQLLGVQNNAMKLEDLKQVVDYQEVKLENILSKRAIINKTLDKLRSDLGKINAQLAQLNARKADPTSEIHVIVNAKSATSGKFQINYIVPNASWYPNYDLRVKDIASPLSMTMKANVSQSTGEEWKEVHLTLSTGNPSESGSKPELQPWRLGTRYIYKKSKADLSYFKRNPNIRHISGIVTSSQGEPLIGASVVIKGTNRGTVTDINGHYELDLTNDANIIVISPVGYSTEELAITQPVLNINLSEATLNEMVVTGYSSAKSRNYDKEDDAKAPVAPTSSAEITVEKQEATTTSYDIDLPYTIPNDGKYNAVEIKEVNTPATYQYYVTPKLDRDAFLTAQVINWEQYNLLSGEANLFFEGTYLGKTYLNTQNTNDTLNISLGRDKNVVVTRTKLNDFTKKGFLSNKRTDSRSFEIAIRNKKSQAINIIVEDQLPLSVNKDIEIENEAKEAELDKITGKLTWKINVAGGKEQKVKFNYTVKYPKDLRLQLE